MPTIAYWPNKIKKGLSNALLSQIDLYASFASLVGIKLQDGEAPDSQNLVDAWLGKSPKGRTFLVEESLVTSLRKENWKYIPPTNKKTNHWLPQKGIEGGYQNTPQLYDLENDVKELNNLAALKPELVDELKKVLKEIIN
jgi:arylsulfatase A-like enzyme